MIGIATAITLIRLSERTLWHLISDGNMTRAKNNDINDKARIPLATIKSCICVHLEPEDFNLIESANRSCFNLTVQRKARCKPWSIS